MIFWKNKTSLVIQNSSYQLIILIPKREMLVHTKKDLWAQVFLESENR